MTSRRLAEQFVDGAAKYVGNENEPPAGGGRFPVFPVRNRGLVDVELGGEFTLAQAGALPDGSEAWQSGAVLSLRHGSTVDIFSTSSQRAPKNFQLAAVISRAPMGGARHPKRYKEGPAKPVTIPWKLRVLARLEQNKKEGKRPSNIDQLMEMVGAAKGSLNALLDLRREPIQWTTKYLDEINEVLGVEPPLFETEDDDRDFWRDVQLLRSLTEESRLVVRLSMERFEKKQ